ncbi:MAG: ABC transporter substrate-binding protein [Sphaerobacter sp.]|nr:ABC transporter substrate-binding protein [Sphaerobacter sp.]
MDIERVVEQLRRGGEKVSRRDVLRLAALSSLGIAGAGLLSACGGGSSEPTTAPSGSTSGGGSTGASSTPRASASPAASGGTPKKGGTWQMAVTANPTAYPITAPGALTDILVNKTIYNCLVQYRLNGDAIEVVPDLAESWEASADLKEYTFKLKSGVTWHDGQPLTADDVKFTMDAVLDPKVNASGRGVVSSIQSTEVVDEHTVKFVLKYPFASLPVMLGYNKPIVPKHLLEGQNLNEPTDFLRKPIGTGPFKFKEFVQGSHLAVEANPDYFDGTPLLDGIIFKVIPDGNARVAQVRSGEIDFTVIEPAQIDALKNVDNIEIRTVPQVNYYFFAINHTKPHLQDVRVRQALVYALDREAIVKQVLKGYGKVATGPINPLLGDYYNPDVATYDYDPDKAAALLKEAGWTKGSDNVLVNAQGAKFTILLNGPKGYPAMEQVITYAQQQYQKLGIQVTLDIVDWPVHLDKYHKLEYDLLMEWWITPPDADLYDHYHSESSSNWWAYKNPEVDDLIVKARSQPDEQQRIALYHELQAKLAEDVPVVYLYYPQEIQAMSKRTHDLPAMGYRDALTWMEKVWVD